MTYGRIGRGRRNFRTDLRIVLRIDGVSWGGCTVLARSLGAAEPFLPTGPARSADGQADTSATAASLGDIEAKIGKGAGTNVSVCRYFYGDDAVTLAAEHEASWRDWLGKTYDTQGIPGA